MIATGWTMSFWLAQALWENAQVILLQYRDWVLWYILITSFISFVICYRFGPVTNPRTKAIIQWFLQVIIFDFHSLFLSNFLILQNFSLFEKTDKLIGNTAESLFGYFSLAYSFFRRSDWRWFIIAVTSGKRLWPVA